MRGSRRFHAERDVGPENGGVRVRHVFKNSFRRRDDKSERRRQARGRPARDEERSPQGAPDAGRWSNSKSDVKPGAGKHMNGVGVNHGRKIET